MIGTELIRESTKLKFDASFVDFDAYLEARYSPPPQLVAIAQADPFWSTLGGSTVDPWGDGGETQRQRRLQGGPA